MRAFSIIALLSATTLAGIAAPAASAAPVAPPSPINLTRVRDVCHLPRSGNDGHVLGSDGGGSIAFGDKVYWIFSDTMVDANRDGLAQQPNGQPQPGEIRPATIARSNDANAVNCLNLHYKTDASGNAAPALPVRTGFQSVWAAGGVVANGNLYWVYADVQNGLPKVSGLAKMTDPATMTSVRLPLPFPADVGGLPINVGGFVYFFHTWNKPQPQNQDPTSPIVNVDTTSKAMIARVPETQIENMGAYTYWNGSTWGSVAAQSAPIFTEGGPGIVNRTTRTSTITNGLAGFPSVAFNTALNRYVAVYSCGPVAGYLCARTTDKTGPDPAALTGAWDGVKTLYRCPDRAFCTHAAQAPAYANGTRIYVSSARDYAAAEHYYETLREIDLSTLPTPSNREMHNAEFDFSKTKKAGGWTYGSRLDTSGELTAMKWKAAKSRWFDPKDAATHIDLDEMTPSGLHTAARAWTAPANGVAEVSGEAWVEQTCGDGVLANIVVVDGHTNARQVVMARALTPTWDTQRSVVYDFPNLALKSGDRISFEVSHGPVNSTCDTVSFKPTIVFDRS